METLILIISILASASGGMLGAMKCYKHCQKLLTSEASIADQFFGSSTTAALLITSLGALGFWLPSTLLPKLLVVAENQQIEEVKTSDRSSQTDPSSPVIDAVPLGE